MESSTDMNAVSSTTLNVGSSASKKLDDGVPGASGTLNLGSKLDDGGIPVVTAQKAPVTVTVLTAVILNVMHSFNFGIAIGTPNNTAVAMQEAFEMSNATWSWVVSIFAVGGIFGGLLGGPITGIVGPKWCQLANNFIWIASGLLQAFAPTHSGTGVALLMVGRALAGVAAGVCCAAVPMYVNDVSPTQVRGAFGVFHQLFVTIGILVSTVLGMNAVFGNTSLWFLLYGIFVVPAGVNFVMIIYPDSPRFLYNKGKEQAAGDALRRLRGPTYSVELELDEYYADRKKEEQEGALGMLQAVRALFTPQYKKQITIGIMLQVFQQLSGINAIMFYSSTIFRAAGMDNSEVAACIVNAFNVLSTFIAVPAIEKLGRRILLLGGFGVMGIFLVLVCVGLTLSWQWPSVIFVVLGVMFFAVGPGPIPWMITSEILVPAVRAGGVTICVFVNWVFTFVVGQVYPFMNDGLGSYSLLPFAVCCFIATGFTIFMVPETRGKSLAEVEAMFGN